MVDEQQTKKLQGLVDELQVPEKLQKIQQQIFSNRVSLKDQLTRAWHLVANDSKVPLLDFKFKLKDVQDGGKAMYLSSFDEGKLNLLTKMVLTLYLDNVRLALESPKECPLFQEQVDDRPQCIQMATQITALCLFKCLAHMSGLSNRSKPLVDPLVFKVLVHMFLLLARDPEIRPNAQQADLMLFYAEFATNKAIQDTQNDAYRAFQQDHLNYSVELQQQYESLIVLSTGLFLMETSLALEDSTLRYSTKLLQNLFQLVERMHSLFYEPLVDVGSLAQFPAGRCFKPLLLEPHSGNYYRKTSMLNVLLLVTIKYVSKVKTTLSEKPCDYILALDQTLVQQMQKAFLRQIKLYQISENYTRVVAKEPSEGDIAIIKEESSQCDSSSEGEEQKQAPSSKDSPVEAKYRKLGKKVHSVESLVKDKEWLDSLPDPVRLEQDSFTLMHIDTQLNWLRVSKALIDLGIKIMPRYYLWTQDKQLVSMTRPTSAMHRMFGLIRVQIYFLMRFELFKPFQQQQVKRLSHIPEHMGYDCYLVQALHQMFNSWLAQSSIPDFNEEVLKQLFYTFDFVARGYFDRVDSQHFLKVQYILFMSFKLEGVQQLPLVTDSKHDGALADSFLRLFKLDFYPEKYVWVFEDHFELDDVQDLARLYDVVAKLEQKKVVVPEDQARAEAVTLLNRVLTQQLAVNLSVQLACTNAQLMKSLIKKVTREVETIGMSQCDPNGSMYVERSAQYTFPKTNEQIPTVEYVFPNAGALTCCLYQLLKFAMRIMSKSLLDDSKNAVNVHSQIFQVLIGSDDNKSRAEYCLRSKFRAFTLNAVVSADDFAPLLVILLQHSKVLTQNLENSDQALMQQFSLSSIKSMMGMSTSEIRQRLGSSRQVVRIGGQKADSSQLGFKVVDKVANMIMRFLVFCSQNGSLALLITERIQPKKAQADSAKKALELQDIANQEFRLLLLRNILFQPDLKTEQVVPFCELLYYYLRHNKHLYAQHRDLECEFRKLYNKNYPNHKQRDFSRQVTQSRDRGVSNHMFVDFEGLLFKHRLQFKRLAQVACSLVCLYVNVVRRDCDSLALFEQRSFLETVLHVVQSLVTLEASYIGELIQAACEVFLFRAKEEPNPFRLDKRTQNTFSMALYGHCLNPMSLIHERYFDLVLSTILDYMQAVCPEPSDSLQLRAQADPEQLTNLLKSIGLVLELINSQIVIRDKSTDQVSEKLTPDLLKLGRAITSESIIQLKKIFIFLKEHSTNASVDVNHILKLLIQVLVTLFGTVPRAVQLRDFFSMFREILYHAQDIDEVDFSLLEDCLHIMYRAMSYRQPQLLAAKPQKLNEQVDHFVFGQMTPGVLLMNSVEVQKEIQICVMFRFSNEIYALPQAKRPFSMVLMSLEDRSEETQGIDGQKGDSRFCLDVELCLDLTGKNKYFGIRDPEQKQREIEKREFARVPVSCNRWYLMVVRLQRKQGYFTAANQIQMEVCLDSFKPEARVTYPQCKSASNARIHLALGNSVDYCMSKKKGNKFFQGRCSIPFFVQGIPEFKNAQESHDLQKSLMAHLSEFIYSKQLLGHKGLQATANIPKDKKCIPVNDFLSLDQLTSQAITAHQVLHKLGYICAVHNMKTSEVLVGIGGFNNMYPLLDKVLNSNIVELGREKPSQIFSYVFRILLQFVNYEPEHIEYLMHQKNLIGQLKYCLIRIGDNDLITTSLIQTIKNVVKFNIYVQQTRAPQQGNYITPHVQSKFKPFYDKFIVEFVQQILLDSSVLGLTCNSVPNAGNQRMSTQIQNQSSHGSQYSRENGQIRKRLVFDEVVELIYDICCPKTDSPQQLLQEDNKVSSNFARLQSTVVNSRTAEQLMKLIQSRPFNKTRNLALLSQLGDALASSLVLLDEAALFTPVVVMVCLTHDKMEKETLLTKLKVILKVMRDDQFKSKKQLQMVIASDTKFHIEKMVTCLQQFKTIPAAKGSAKEQTLYLRLLDQITAYGLLVTVQAYLNKKTKLVKHAPLNEKVASLDPEKRQLLKIISDQLVLNSEFHRETVLTLMFITFGKSDGFTSRIPQIEEVASRIKKCQVRWQSTDKKSHVDVCDFDIDFFFLTVEHLPRFTQDAQEACLNLLCIFIRYHQENFMRVFHGQAVTTEGNPFDSRLKEFLYRLVKLQLESSQPQIVQSCKKLIVEICVFQLKQSLDETNGNELDCQDEWSINLLRLVLTYFETDSGAQLNVMIEVVSQLLKVVHGRKNAYTNPEQCKLNLKLIHLLQYVEEYFYHKREQLSLMPEFQVLVVLMMYLFEQMGILTLDIPDRVSCESAAELDRASKAKKAAKSVKSSQMLTQPNGGQGNQFDLLTGLDDPLKGQLKQHEHSSKGFSPVITEQLKEQILPMSNFVSGGPARIFLHLLLSMLLCDHDFQNTIEMLRYLVLRERGQFLKHTIKMLGNSFNTQSVQMYTLFNRQAYIKRRFSKKYQKQPSNDDAVPQMPASARSSATVNTQLLISESSVKSNRPARQPIIDYIDCEMKIFHMTMNGICDSTNRKVSEEQFKANDTKSKTQSASDLAIAETSLNELAQLIDKNEMRLGFTNIQGFLAMQLIAEIIRVMHLIVAKPIQTDMQFQEEFKQHQDPNLDTVFLNSNQVHAATHDPDTFQKLVHLLNFLHDCLQSEFAAASSDSRSSTRQSSRQSVKISQPQSMRENITKSKVLHKVVQSLYGLNPPQSTSKSNNQISSILFFSSYLENQQEEFKPVLRDQVQIIQSNKLKMSPEFALTMGMAHGPSYLQNLGAYGYPSGKAQQHVTTTSQKQMFAMSEFNQMGHQKDKLKLLKGKINVQTGPNELVQTHNQKAMMMTVDNLLDEEPHFDGLDSLVGDRDIMEQQDLEERKSWVENIKTQQKKGFTTSKQSTSSQQQQVPSEWSTLMQSVPQEYRDQYLNQVTEYILHLSAILTLMRDKLNIAIQNQMTQMSKQESVPLQQDDSTQRNSIANDDGLRECVIKIIQQTLCKEKQRKIFMAFGQATSHQFMSIMLQVRLNTDTKLAKINEDVLKMKQQGKPQAQSSQLPSDQQHRNFIQRMMTTRPRQTTQTNQNESLQVPQSSQQIPQNQQNSEQVEAQQQENKILSDLMEKEKHTISHLFSEFSYMKLVKRIQEDEASMWYDHIEEQQAQFKEIKDIYDCIQNAKFENKNVDTAEKRHQKNVRRFREEQKDNNEDVRRLFEFSRILDYLSCQSNPKRKQCFVAQRRNVDNWGRMMFLKPNRKAINYDTWLFYDYYVHDYLNKVFAVSLLNDEDLPDYQKNTTIIKNVKYNDPTLNEQRQLINRLEVQLGGQQAEPAAPPTGGSNNAMQVSPAMRRESMDSNASENQYQTIAFSTQLQRKRLELLRKIERHGLLKRVLTNQSKSSTEPNEFLADSQATKLFLIQKYNQNLLTFEAQQVRVQGTTWGHLIVTKDLLYFQSACIVTPSEREDLKFVDCNGNLTCKQEIFFQWEQIDEIMKRKLVNIFQGIDITTHEKKVYTFNLCDEDQANKFLFQAELYLSQKKNTSQFTIIRDPRAYFTAGLANDKQEHQFLTEWKNGQKSNMEFLMLANKYAGRSFNDLSQYPFFPWVIKDFTSPAIEFADKMRQNQVYRDLTKHTGNISDFKAKKAVDSWDDTLDEIDDVIQVTTYGRGPFNIKYGLSASLVVSQWLCRLEPFTSLNYRHSDYKRDPRVPIDFALSYDNLLKDKTVMAEQLPECFFLPEIMMNPNKLAFGNQVNHNKDDQDENDPGFFQIDAMFLPPWAVNYHDLVRIMREALESKHVSAQLGHWMDLTFGVHQKNSNKQNMFHPSSYDDFWTKDKLKSDPEALKLKLNDQDYIHRSQKDQIMNFCIAPSKVFDRSIGQLFDEKHLKLDRDNNLVLDENKAKIYSQIIKAFIENQKSKSKLFLGQIAVHCTLDSQTHICHMIFNNEKKCLVFVRVPDTQLPNLEKLINQQDQNVGPQPAETGSLVVFLYQETLSRDSFKQKPFDLGLRYEQVCDDFTNVFQVCAQNTTRLYACGYLDNSVRVFELEGKPHLLRVIRDHNARVTCIRLSSCNRYFISCDEDGVILHYGQSNQMWGAATSSQSQIQTSQSNIQSSRGQLDKESRDLKDTESFAYKLMYRLHDQFDEIVAIDTNPTLDVYVTVSRDGSVAVRCQRTSRVWYHFKLYCSQPCDKPKVHASKIFKKVVSVKLSHHGYIVVIGENEVQKVNCRYLVYNLSGDVLLRDMQDKHTIKGVFLNTNEDQLVVAQNQVKNGAKFGQVIVYKLFTLEKVTNLSNLIYGEALDQISLQKHNAQQVSSDKKNTPLIAAIAMKKGEASLNIFFDYQKEDNDKRIKEIICFETSKFRVWDQLNQMALTPNIAQ